MKNKKLVIILTSMMVLIGGILYVNQIYNKSKNKHIPKRNNLAIMVKDESGEYVSSDAIPKGNYVLNEEKTICENNGKVLNYDSSTGKVSFSFIGSDRCSLYFDYNDTTSPVFRNVTYLNNTFSATLYDDSKVVGYQITNSFTEPTSYIDVTDNKLSLTLQDNKNYYIWIKDASNNVKYYYQNTSTSKTSLKNYIVNRYTNQNEIKERTNFKEVYQDKNDSLFKTTESTDNKTIYYYAGDTQNNWVKFGRYSNDWYGCLTDSTTIKYQTTKCDDNQKTILSIPKTRSMYWRIIRTNEDDGVKLLYSGTSPFGLDNYIGSSIYNPYMKDIYCNNIHITEYGLNPYAGYFHKTSSNTCTESDIMPLYNVNGVNSFIPISVMLIWLQNTIGISDIYFSKKYCEEGYTVRANYPQESVTYSNLKYASPSYKCIGTEFESYISLITANELVFAGNVSLQRPSNIYYNLNGDGRNYSSLWWSMSPAFFDGVETNIYIINGQTNEFSSQSTNLEARIRPVISLASCANYSSGDGSPDSPYEIDLSSCS